MKFLIDMNMSPQRVEVFVRNGWEAVHWSSVGDPRAPDWVLMDWARVNGFIVFTHDLDFGAILAVTRAEGPSVIQVRTQDVTPRHLEEVMLRTLGQHAKLLEQGALVVVDEVKTRARILPLAH